MCVLFHPMTQNCSRGLRLLKKHQWRHIVWMLIAVFHPASTSPPHLPSLGQGHHQASPHKPQAYQHPGAKQPLASLACGRACLLEGDSHADDPAVDRRHAAPVVHTSGLWARSLACTTQDQNKGKGGRGFCHHSCS
jgi:hypothetical protein